MTQSRRTNSDFDPEDFTKKSDEHDKILNQLQKRVGTNENYGKTFAEAAKDSVSLRESVEEIVIGLLQTNVKTQTAVEKVVKDVDGRELKSQLFTLGKVVLWILSLVATVVITTWVNHKVK